MYKYIDEELIVVDPEEEVRAKQMLCIVLCALGICIFALLNINLYAYIFDGADKVDSLLRSVADGIAWLFNSMSPNNVMDQIKNMF